MQNITRGKIATIDKTSPLTKATMGRRRADVSIRKV